MLLETQLKIADLKYENEELTNKNEKVTNTYTQTEVTAVTGVFFTRLRGAHVLITKLRKQTLDKDSIHNRKFSLEDTFSGSIPPRIKSILSPNIR